MGRPLINLAGQRFARLAVLARGRGGQGRSTWLCECDCGRRKEVSARSLKSGETQSCGCLNSKLTSTRNAALKRTHGQTNTRLYRIWIGMRRRCYEPRMQSYPYYGGRGITVCEEWTRFEPFLAWANANGYASHLEIDRIDTDGHYTPKNCRWVTKSVNASNRRNSKSRRAPCESAT